MRRVRLVGVVYVVLQRRGRDLRCGCLRDADPSAAGAFGRVGLHRGRGGVVSAAVVAVPAASLMDQRVRVDGVTLSYGELALLIASSGMPTTRSGLAEDPAEYVREGLRKT